MQVKATVDHEALSLALDALAAYGAVDVVLTTVTDGVAYVLNVVASGVAAFSFGSVATGFVVGTLTTRLEVLQKAMECIPTYVTDLTVNVTEQSVELIFTTPGASTSSSFILTYTSTV